MDSLLSLTVNTLKWMTWPSLPCSVWVWTSLDLYVTFCISGSEVVIHYLEKMTQNSLPCFIHALSFSLSLSPSSPPPPVLSCVANSTYSECMSPCPASCADLAAPSDCDFTACVEGCQCSPGFTMSEGICVPYSECGCTYLDRYYPVS